MPNFFFFNDTATTEIYTLSLHDALPICQGPPGWQAGGLGPPAQPRHSDPPCLDCEDPKSTRLNSSHSQISYAVFCLKKKKFSFSLFPISVSICTISPLYSTSTHLSARDS